MWKTEKKATMLKVNVKEWELMVNKIEKLESAVEILDERVKKLDRRVKKLELTVKEQAARLKILEPHYLGVAHSNPITAFSPSPPDTPESVISSITNNIVKSSPSSPVSAQKPKVDVFDDGTELTISEKHSPAPPAINLRKTSEILSESEKERVNQTQPGIDGLENEGDNSAMAPPTPNGVVDPTSSGSSTNTSLTGSHFFANLRKRSATPASSPAGNIHSHQNADQLDSDQISPGATVPSLKSPRKTGKEKRTFKCKECGKAFMTKQRVERHLPIHFEELKKHVCLFCDKRFAQPGQLETHLRVHTGERPFQCGRCLGSFFSQMRLKCHNCKG